MITGYIWYGCHSPLRIYCTGMFWTLPKSVMGTPNFTGMKFPRFYLLTSDIVILYALFYAVLNI